MDLHHCAIERILTKPQPSVGCWQLLLHQAINRKPLLSFVRFEYNDIRSATPDQCIKRNGEVEDTGKTQQKQKQPQQTNKNKNIHSHKSLNSKLKKEKKKDEYNTIYCSKIDLFIRMIVPV